MLAVILLKAHASSVEQSEYVFSAVIRCSFFEFQLLLLIRHPPKTLLLSRRTSTTILTYRDPRILEQPYCLLRGHAFLLRLQRPPAMSLDLLFLLPVPPEGRGQVCSIQEVSVNSCQVSTIQFRHHLTHCLAKSLFPFLSARLFSAYQILICRGTCAEETRHRLYHRYPSPGLKRRWLHH